ncbi:hypothetical protein ACA910_005991 [Epithemia clementina (nom. ined.)]
MSTINARTALDEMGEKGEFIRKDAAHRNWIKNDPAAQFPAEKDRYHLYVSYACPWACRTLMMRALKGLEDVISVTVVHPIWQKTRPEKDTHAGWIFGDASGAGKHAALTNSEGNGGPFSSHFQDTEPDPFTGSNTIREVYESVDDKDGKYSVPVLYDKKQKLIVSNESSDIIRMFNTEFNHLAKNPDTDFYPEDMRKTIDELNEWIYPSINNGVYRCGFAKSQEAYDKAIEELTVAFDRVEEILQKQRYIAGDIMTEADIRLFVTLVRFDEVYTVYFKTSTRYVARSESILNYVRDIYQTPGVRSTVNMEHIKHHYYCSHPLLNHWSIVPKATTRCSCTSCRTIATNYLRNDLGSIYCHKSPRFEN